MKPAMIDVELEIPRGELLDSMTSTQAKNAVSTAIVERCREKAAAEVELVGGRLNMARPPEFYIRRGSHVTFGGDFILVASRWHAEMPECFENGNNVWVGGHGSKVGIW